MNNNCGNCRNYSKGFCSVKLTSGGFLWPILVALVLVALVLLAKISRKSEQQKPPDGGIEMKLLHTTDFYTAKNIAIPADRIIKVSKRNRTINGIHGEYTVTLIMVQDVDHDGTEFLSDEPYDSIIKKLEALWKSTHNY